MSALSNLLKHFRDAAVSEREKGTYFEDLVASYLRNEATYRDLYSDVWTYADWAKAQGLDARDIGIDLVAKTQGTGDYHAIQCKFYPENYHISKKDIDSFFTASGKKPFAHRIVVSTTTDWSEHADDALRDQRTPVSKIDLHDLENSQIDWSKYQPRSSQVLKAQKALRPHQQSALTATLAGLKQADRGKLIMACGTGKTFTSLKIAESMSGKGKRVLFLVPSLALLSQALTEWTQESTVPLHSFAVCSDSDVGKKRTKDDDTVQTFIHELRYPATTESGRLAVEMKKRHDQNHMSVVFATYQSIGVISRAQKEYDLAAFDLIVCDEAHRTTGATFEGEDESNFVKVHDAKYIRAAKRIYMTATPRIYGELAKASAEKDNVVLCSMDDKSLYGDTLYVLTFSEAVKRDLLVDYKVIVLSVDEAHVSRRIQSLLKDENNQLKVDDAAKIIGCWKALSKQGLEEQLARDQDPMRRAVAFCQVIEVQKGARTHKVSSKNIANMFQAVVEAYQKSGGDEVAVQLICEAAHVDGGMNASQKEEKLDWLKANTPEHTCRILSNVRCLSEGVDVPALDAVLFLTPRNSQVDVVQSVGRVMRKAPGKERGYIVLPVVIPTGMEPHEALNDNKTYKVVWQVLQALRSHDDRFDAMINKLDLIGKDPRKMEVVAITDQIQKKQKKASGTTNRQAGKGSHSIGEASDPNAVRDQSELQFEIGEIERAIYAKLVQKVGNRQHWEEWANDIAKIARTHIDRITGILDNKSHARERKAFDEFANELRDDLNDEITDAEIIEMLAQHLVTKPVFDALFENYSFAKHNPMSQAMQNVLDVLQEHRLEKEADTLQAFYDSVKLRAEGIVSAEGKQKIIKELYDKFFNGAFPELAKRLGIVYTPIEVVDFIIHSVNDILQREFNQSLGSNDVHILDPFTGTGTFITRLLQSNLISSSQLKYKYRDEIHANEIVLLAYYIAAINIEATYHDIVGGAYVPFEGICLTDTFQMYEKDDMVDALLVDNSARRKRQKKLDIRVIIGNPPYSARQDSANDNNQNVAYPHLDGRIRETYAAHSQSDNLRNLYDPYVRAIRWASDRIGDNGVIGFVCGSSFVEKPTMDGLRKCLSQEFTSIHILNLRGDIRKNMLSKGRAREGQNIFGSGSMTGIAITLFVKRNSTKEKGMIYYHNIGDDLTQSEKLEKVNEFMGVTGIESIGGWELIEQDRHGDWINQRDDSFSKHIVLGDKKDQNSKKLFEAYSQGVLTSRDSWCSNFNRSRVLTNISRMISSYNDEVKRFKKVSSGLTRDESPDVDTFINLDPKYVGWSRGLKKGVTKGTLLSFDEARLVQCQYRPFTKTWLYFDRRLNEYVSQMSRIFPDSKAENAVICVSGTGARSGFSTFISKSVTDFQTIDNGQCFPLYLYEEYENDELESAPQSVLFKSTERKSERKRRDAVTDVGLGHFQSYYKGEVIGKEDIFYYVYGLLHSPDYRKRYADNLTKELPRIPCVKNAIDFWAFSKAGRSLADLHLNYETVPMYSEVIIDGDKNADYRVEKMKYGKNGKDKDLTTLIYNNRVRVTGIPLQAYEYVINGKPALDWVVERYCVKTDKESGIVNDANDWAIEAMHNPRYPLELFLRIITVSVESLRIVGALPTLHL